MSKIFTDSPEKTKKMLLQVLGHQALVLSEPEVKTKVNVLSYLIQEKPNSHFVSHTICFKVKHLSSVTFKELLLTSLK